MSDLQQSSAQLKYRIYYNFGSSAKLMPWMYDEAQKAQLKILPSGSAELQYKEEVLNDESSFFQPNGFFRRGRRFAGWRVRVRSDGQWLWILENGAYALKSSYDVASMAPIRRFREQERIPYLSLPQIDLMVAEAVWEECPAASFTLLYNSGTKAPELTWDYEKAPGQTSRLKTGSAEYCPGEPTVNDRGIRLEKYMFRYPGHVFAGWHLRLKCHDQWYWLLDDLSVRPKASYDKRQERPIRLFRDGEELPFLAEPGLTVVVLEAVWEAVSVRM